MEMEDIITYAISRSAAERKESKWMSLADILRQEMVWVELVSCRPPNVSSLFYSKVNIKAIQTISIQE